jgi:uncharacterized membrane protein
MKTENKILMKQARESLSGKWGSVVGVMLVYMAIVCAIQSIPSVGGIISLFISGSMSLGLAIYSLSFSRNREPRLEQLFDGFKKYAVSLRTYLLVILYTLLWSLLFIIPGIIASISYSMVFFILADGNYESAKDVIEKSKKMMYGHKWKFFCLQLRFIGWGLLCILTLGIGFLWLFPYIQISNTKFYEDLVKENI